MAKDFKIRGGLHGVPTVKCTIASATVIEAGDLVTLTDGLVTKAAANSATIAYAPHGSANGEVVCDVTVGNDFELLGTGDANFAVANKGTEVDLVGTTTLLIDLGTSTTDVLKVCIDEDAGTVGATTNIAVKINKPLF
jgi:hypothetical protein